MNMGRDNQRGCSEIGSAPVDGSGSLSQCSSGRTQNSGPGETQTGAGNSIH